MCFVSVCMHMHVNLRKKRKDMGYGMIFDTKEISRYYMVENELRLRSLDITLHILGKDMA